jgi:oxygen-independent coproporphyrinogen III oxidase
MSDPIVSYDDARLDLVRRELFYGLTDYTKSFPDFSLVERFTRTTPRDAEHFLADLGQSLAGEPEVMVYVHLPFCFEECAFCNAFPLALDRELQARYVDALLREMKFFIEAGIFEGRRVRCVYFGGGTPTTFSRRDIGRILDRIRDGMTLAADANVTCEAHPEAMASETRCREMAALGIDRISLGCQTFDPRVLGLCNRDNSDDLLRRVVPLLRAAGLAVNVDMMLGLPGQTHAGVRRDLALLDEIRPDAIEYMRHEIVNPLAIELYRHDPDLLVGDDALFEMVSLTQAWLAERGYEQNGRFTGPDHFPYRYHWLRGLPFISFGARARSYTRQLCYDKHEELSLYLRLLERGLPPVARTWALSTREQMYRTLFLGVQIRAGIDRDAFVAQFGVEPIEAFGDLLTRLVDLDCLEIDAGSVRLTDLGCTFTEDVCCRIIDAALAEDASGHRRAPHSSGVGTSKLESS